MLSPSYALLISLFGKGQMRQMHSTKNRYWWPMINGDREFVLRGTDIMGDDEVPMMVYFHLSGQDWTASFIRNREKVSKLKIRGNIEEAESALIHAYLKYL